MLFKAFLSCKLLRKAITSAHAGLRMLRVSSNSWATPYAGSFRDCTKVNCSESLIGRFKTLLEQGLGC